MLPMIPCTVAGHVLRRVGSLTQRHVRHEPSDMADSKTIYPQTLSLLKTSSSFLFIFHNCNDLIGKEVVNGEEIKSQVYSLDPQVYLCKIRELG